jgi:hypothetical protein
LTVAVTPSSPLSRFSIRAAQEAQVMPPISSSTIPVAAGSLDPVVFDVMTVPRSGG